MTSLLQDYTAVPWDHYKNTPKPFRNDFPVALHNGSPTPENNQFAGQFTIDQAGTQLNQFSIAGSQLSNGDLNYAVSCNLKPSGLEVKYTKRPLEF